MDLDRFFEMVTVYNETFRLLPFVAFVLGGTVILAAARGGKAVRVVFFLLAVLWLWSGAVFALGYFGPFHPFGYITGTLFVIQTGALLWAAITHGDRRLSLNGSAKALIGWILVLYATAGYALVEVAVGRNVSEMLFLGLTPCPTAIFTLGIFLWFKERLPLWVTFIPVAYAVSGVIPAYYGLVEDLGLAIAGVIGLVFLILKRPASESVTAATA